MRKRDGNQRGRNHGADQPSIDGDRVAVLDILGCSARTLATYSSLAQASCPGVAGPVRSPCYVPQCRALAKRARGCTRRRRWCGCRDGERRPQARTASARGAPAQLRTAERRGRRGGYRPVAEIIVDFRQTVLKLPSDIAHALPHLERREFEVITQLVRDRLTELADCDGKKVPLPKLSPERNARSLLPIGAVACTLPAWGRRQVRDSKRPQRLYRERRAQRRQRCCKPCVRLVTGLNDKDEQRSRRDEATLRGGALRPAPGAPRLSAVVPRLHSSSSSRCTRCPWPSRRNWSRYSCSSS